LATVCGICLLFASPIALHAQFTYATNNGTITITGYTGLGGDVIIPGEIHGLPVTSIGYSAFYFGTNLTGIVIPPGVTDIGGTADLSQVVGDRDLCECAAASECDVSDARDAVRYRNTRQAIAVSPSRPRKGSPTSGPSSLLLPDRGMGWPRIIVIPRVH
jgi:hypothetical protein